MSNQDDEMRTKPVSLSFAGPTLQMLDALKPRFGINSRSALAAFAIAQLYRKTFPAYAGNYMGSNLTQSSPEAAGQLSAKRKIAQEQTIKQAKLQEKINVCEVDLMGQVVDDGAGNNYCIYHTHTPKEDFEQKIPLEGVVPALADNLFIPNKEFVLRKRPELAKKLGIKTNKK